MVVGIIDYGAGNLFSVQKAMKHLGAIPEVVSAPEELMGKDVLLLPGVGAFGTAMKSLSATGLDEKVKEWAQLGRPLLGICLGMQLLFDRSEEDANASGLGILAGSVKSFPKETSVAVPHMGWNLVHVSNGSRLGRADGYFYFAHSYYCQPENAELITGVTEHGISFPSIIEVPGGMLFGVQFHPEKSGEAGLELLQAFLREAASC